MKTEQFLFGYFVALWHAALLWLGWTIGTAIGASLFVGCNGIDINAKIRPSIPGRPDPNEVKPPEPPKPDPYDWEPWWARKRPQSWKAPPIPSGGPRR